MSTPKPHLVTAPDVMWRVARLGMGTRFSEIEPADALSQNAGNRFDVVGGGVLYTSTDIEGCYREVLARLRPAPGMVDLDEDEGGHMRAGNVAASWRENRRRFALAVPEALPFVDVEHQDTWNALEAAITLPPNVPHLDVGHIRGADRLLTRAIATWAYTQTDDEGESLYSGLRYLSRTGDFECWAIFDGTPVIEIAPAGEITNHDKALRRVAEAYRLTLH
ncbi:RES domain-containing protein [Georgenia soli]|uniref:RES domain-containing protein n=1 Tax=Georgenia soli TaxID=638953 RepID=A0A2A9F359_9MICO|nr:RES domain-containing protein [Georgenia soli]PFG44992.1 RES domain-containing protein [Georgenia soli]